MVLVDNLESLLARGQDNALLRYSLGGEYLKLEQFDKASEHLRKSVEYDPHYSAAWKLLGEALVGAGLKAEAIIAYEKGILVAETRGDKQAAKEMGVFLRRLQKK
jgi:tetratricopeptide (TPR) repeat protein